MTKQTRSQYVDNTIRLFLILFLATHWDFDFSVAVTGLFSSHKRRSRGGRLTSGQLGLLQPLGQNGLQLAGVLEAQLQVLEAADGGLAELGAVHGSQGLAHVGLCVAWRSEGRGGRDKNATQRC